MCVESLGLSLSLSRRLVSIHTPKHSNTTQESSPGSLVSSRLLCMCEHQEDLRKEGRKEGGLSPLLSSLQHNTYYQYFSLFLSLTLDSRLSLSLTACWPVRRRFWCDVHRRQKTCHHRPAALKAKSLLV